MTELLPPEPPKPRKLENGEVVQDQAPPKNMPHHPFIPDEIILEAMKKGEAVYEAVLPGGIRFRLRVHR